MGVLISCAWGVLVGKLNKRHCGQLLAVLSTGLLITSYQNCSKVAVQDQLDSASMGLQPQGGGQELVLKDFSQKVLLNPDNNKLDIVLVIDNSGSMKEDSTKLANRLEGFIQDLSSSSIDWQACITTTDVGSTAGKSLQWRIGNGKRVINKMDSNLSVVFADTIASFFTNKGAGDERGVYALKKNLEYISSSGCYREGSLVSTIILSDEDERSVGSDKNYYKFLVDSQQITQKDLDNQYKGLTSDDDPAQLLVDFRNKLPNNRLIANSIVIPEGDRTCLDDQLKNSASFYGRVYQQLSTLTGGAVGSICSNDYSATLEDFAATIKQAFAKVELDCTPANFVNVDLLSGTAPSWNLTNKTMNISNIVSSAEIMIKYQCWVKP